MIVDASAFVSSLGSTKIARSLLGEELAAPELLVTETLNAFWKVARTGVAVPDRRLILTMLDRIRLASSRLYAARAAELAERLDHPVYDCLYLAMAEAEADVLFTTDARLARKLSTRALRRLVRLAR